jgi:NADP-dependent 3-hydroxy acid dehydrogenase YdfG/acyl carrier protein
LMPGELSQKAATLLAPFGQFVCLSGATTVTTSWLQGNRVLRRIDMAQLIAHQPDTMRQLWQEASTGLAEGALSALPRRQINHAQLRELEQTGANATQSGIIDVELDAPTPGKRLFDAEASYLITGGFGGFGLACAQWMVEQGARHIALVGRRGADTLQAQQAVHALQQAGATVMCAAADVSLEADVIKLIDEISQTMPPLRGVFHTAAVLKDSPINQILPEHVHAVMNPKAAGAWYLHQHTQSTSLDYFVLFSSVAGLIGGPGQASYAMSCEYQDALARHRRALGLAATSINWGALAEVGMVARHSEVAKYFSVTGVGSFSPAQAVDLLGKALAWNPVNIGMAIMNWPSWGATYPAWAASPKYAELAGDTGEQDQASDDSALINSLRAMADAERLQSVEDILASHLAKVCQMPLERIDRQASLLNMGLDSLMSMELQMTIETELGVKVSTLELMKGNNLIQLAHVIAGALMDKIPSKQARPTDHPANSAESIPSVSEQVDSLQDDEIDKLLSQLLKQEQVQA